MSMDEEVISGEKKNNRLCTYTPLGGCSVGPCVGDVEKNRFESWRVVVGKYPFERCWGLINARDLGKTTLLAFTFPVRKRSIVRERDNKRHYSIGAFFLKLYPISSLQRKGLQSRLVYEENPTRKQTTLELAFVVLEKNFRGQLLSEGNSTFHFNF